MGVQKTISRPVDLLGGINVYTNEEIIVSFYSLEENKGIVFNINGEEIRSDLDNANLEETAIFLKGEKNKIGIIEHFLPSIYALGIDNLLVKINFDREPFALPTFERGSGVVFKILKEAGIKEQNARKKYLTTNKKILFKHTDKAKKDFISIVPSKRFVINYRVFFPHKAVGEQVFSFNVDENNFATQVMEARSPAFHDRSSNYTDNINGKFNLLIGEKEEENYLNEPRYNGQEFVRHKVLDFLGTLALFGKQFKNIEFNVNMSGHAFDLSTLKQCKKNNYFEEVN